MNIIGLSAFYHESACCLLQDGKLVAAAAEERFSRVKHDPRLPVEAFRYCLRAGGIDITEVDAVAYYECPDKKLERQRLCGIPEDARADYVVRDNQQIEQMLRERLGHEGPVLFYDHHLSHAASAFFYSGFNDAAILTVDGVGEWDTMTYGRGAGSALEIFEGVRFPHSLGLLYATITAYLGFKVNSGEYKVMGLAPYGQPRYLAQMQRVISSATGGQFTLDMTYFDFVQGRCMYTEALCELLGEPARASDAEITRFHCDVARSLQELLESILLDKIRYLRTYVNTANLCLAGGVALNCVANSRILGNGPFERLFVQPAAGDAGGSLGAAALAHRQLTGTRHSYAPLRTVYLGPAWTNEDVGAILSSAEIPAYDFYGRESGLLEAVVDRLVQGQVIGWFQGGMEFGPRALGARSILADPRDPKMRQRINHLVKKREAFRPFAPSVLAHHAANHFELDHPVPFMLETCQVRAHPLDGAALNLPAVTHVDGSARPQTVDYEQNPRFAALLEAFYRRTGCPILLNTSLNVAGEPIACSPADALMCLGKANLDALVLEDLLIERDQLLGWDRFPSAGAHAGEGLHPLVSVEASSLAGSVDAPPEVQSYATLYSIWPTARRSAFDRSIGALQEHLYTFV